MFKRNLTSGVVGVLSDFDLASFEGDMGKNTERTGTLPFMACDLLTEEGLKGQVRHTYAHDAEAFFWVAVIDTAFYPIDTGDSKQVRNNDILDWVTGSVAPIMLGALKERWLLRTRNHTVMEKQKICWDGGFSQLICMWLLRQFDMALNPGLVRTEAELYDDYIRIRGEHERSHPELMRDGLTSD